MATKGGGNPALFLFATILDCVTNLFKRRIYKMTRNDYENIAEDGEREQQQRLEKSRKQQRKRRNEPKNAKQANEQS